MAKLIISRGAKQDIRQILENVAQYTGSAKSAEKLHQEFLAKFSQIVFLPKAAKLLNDGTRQAFCRRYRIIYREIGEEIHIIAVLHSLKKYP